MEIMVRAEGGVYSHFLDSNTDGDPIFSILGAFLFPTPLLLQHQFSFVPKL